MGLVKLNAYAVCYIYRCRLLGLSVAYFCLTSEPACRGLTLRLFVVPVLMLNSQEGKECGQSVSVPYHKEHSFGPWISSLPFLVCKFRFYTQFLHSAPLQYNQSRGYLHVKTALKTSYNGCSQYLRFQP